MHAMNRIGFVAKSNGGSEVRFKPGPECLFQGKKIVIHSPHPEHELDSDRLKDIGNRLTRRFKMGGENFELKS